MFIVGCIFGLFSNINQPSGLFTEGTRKLFSAAGTGISTITSSLSSSSERNETEATETYTTTQHTVRRRGRKSHVSHVTKAQADESQSESGWRVGKVGAWLWLTLLSPFHYWRQGNEQQEVSGGSGRLGTFFHWLWSPFHSWSSSNDSGVDKVDGGDRTGRGGRCCGWLWSILTWPFRVLGSIVDMAMKQLGRALYYTSVALVTTVCIVYSALYGALCRCGKWLRDGGSKVSRGVGLVFSTLYQSSLAAGSMVYHTVGYVSGKTYNAIAGTPTAIATATRDTTGKAVSASSQTSSAIIQGTHSGLGKMYHSGRRGLAWILSIPILAVWSVGKLIWSSVRWLWNGSAWVLRRCGEGVARAGSAIVAGCYHPITWTWGLVKTAADFLARCFLFVVGGKTFFPCDFLFRIT